MEKDVLTCLMKVYWSDVRNQKIKTPTPYIPQITRSLSTLIQAR